VPPSFLWNCKHTQIRLKGCLSISTPITFFLLKTIRAQDKSVLIFFTEILIIGVTLAKNALNLKTFFQNILMQLNFNNMSSEAIRNKWLYVCNKMNCELMLTYDTPALRQTGSRNLTGQKTLPTIWGTYMKLVTKYQISAINSCWEKCDEKCAYMFNVYRNQLSWQTGSRNLSGPKTLPTIWYTYMMLVTKYQISAINSYWEKCDEKYLGRTEGQR
jgi:hypothetical protein